MLSCCYLHIKLRQLTQDLVTLDSKQSLAIVCKEGPEHLSQGGTVLRAITPVARAVCCHSKTAFFPINNSQARNG